ncbi:MAG: uroporphyrinogen decarboxylase family protein [Sphaerochaetaceae bacterium]|jgi:hypothetical protein|nr:uroporphyrinogen decarboxylase family protein [Sphaerochaetaceae bacterium]
MDRKTLLQTTVKYDFPSAIPVIFHINMVCWDHYDRSQLADIILSYPQLFPEGLPVYSNLQEEVPFLLWTDLWGCVWETKMGGLIGTVTQHSLANLEKVHTYTPPDPDRTTHWYLEKGSSPTGGSIGFFSCLRSGEIGHGHTFLKLLDLLGYEQAIYTLYDDPAELSTLLAMLQDLNLGLVERFVEYADVEWMGFAEDLGMHKGPMLSPTMFKKHILPLYKNIMAPAEQHGSIIHMHSDGDIRDLAEDLLTLPIRVFNVLDRVNTLEWIKKTIKNRVAIDLDIDRQFITQQEDPKKVLDYLSYLMQTMYDPAGGLILTYSLYLWTPIPIIQHMMDYLEEVTLGGKLCIA